MSLFDRAKQAYEAKLEAAPPWDGRDSHTVNFEDVATPVARAVAQAWFELMEVEPVALRVEYFEKCHYDPVGGDPAGDYYYYLHGYFELEGQLFRVCLELDGGKLPMKAENSTRYKPKYKADVEMRVAEWLNDKGAIQRSWEAVRTLADVGQSLERWERSQELQRQKAEASGAVAGSLDPALAELKRKLTGGS